MEKFKVTINIESPLVNKEVPSISDILSIEDHKQLLRIMRILAEGTTKKNQS